MNDKNRLRYKYKIKRKYFQHSAREVADGAIFDAALAALGGYESFFVYYSFGTEADTRALIAELKKLGKRVYLPRVEGDGIVPVLYSGDKDKLVKNAFGIEEPQGEPCREDIQVCITPLLAVNPKGYRLGYGGGYYDGYFRANKQIVKIGLGYFLQYAEDFREEKWDEPLDKFICERGIIDFGN